MPGAFAIPRTIRFSPLFRHFVQPSKFLSAHVTQPRPFQTAQDRPTASRCQNASLGQTSRKEFGIVALGKSLFTGYTAPCRSHRSGSPISANTLGQDETHPCGASTPGSAGHRDRSGSRHTSHPRSGCAADSGRFGCRRAATARQVTGHTCIGSFANRETRDRLCLASTRRTA